MMKPLPLCLAVITISLFAAGCGGGKESEGEGSRADTNAGQHDSTPSPDHSPRAGSQHTARSTGGGSSESDPEYADRPAAVPPVPKSKLLDSIGRALIKGAQKVGGEEE